MTQLQPPPHPTPESLAERFAMVFDPVDGCASLAGFEGFKERTVADIETRSGHYSEICVALGAKSLTCFETNLDTIGHAWDAGRLRDTNIHIGDAAELSHTKRFAGRFDIVTVYNISPHKTYKLIGAARRLLKDGGDLVVTSTEVGLLSRVSEIERATTGHFKHIDSTRVWSGRTAMPANNMITLALGKKGENDG